MAGFGLGNYINPQVGSFIDQRRNALAGLGAGLLSGQPGAGVQAGIQADDAYATQQKAEAERQKAITDQQALRAKYADFFTKQGKPEIAQAISDGITEPGQAYWDFITPKAPKSPYEGTGMDAQNWNILLTGDPASPEYAAAWSQINQPKITYTQGPEGLLPVIQNPNIPANIRPPAGMAAPTGGAPGGGPTVGAALPGTAKPLTEQQNRAKMMTSVILPEVKGLLGDEKTPGTFDALANGFDIAKSATGDAGRVMPFGMGTPSETFLKAQGSIKTVVTSYLYVVSGATANPGEVQTQVDVLTPKLNDPPGVIADKKARLKVMAQAVEDASNGKPVDFNALDAAGSSSGVDDLLKKYGVQ